MVRHKGIHRAVDGRTLRQRCLTSQGSRASIHRLSTGGTSEAHLPAEQEQAPRLAWFSQAHEHSGRPEDPQPAAGEGKIPPHGLVAAGRPRGTPRPPREGVRARHHPFVGHLQAGLGLRPALLVLAIGRRSGGAAVRSRIKRQLREAFREAALRLPEGARVEIAAHGDLSRLPRRAVRAAAGALLRRLIQQWQAGDPSRESSAGASSEPSGSTGA